MMGAAGAQRAGENGTRSDADPGWGPTTPEGEGRRKPGCHPGSGSQLLVCLSLRMPLN